MIAHNQRKSKRDQYNDVQNAYSNFYNEKIDALIFMALSKNIKVTEIAECLEVTPKAIYLRLENARKFKTKEEAK